MTDGQPAARLPRWRRVLDTLASVSNRGRVCRAHLAHAWPTLGGRRPSAAPYLSGSVAAQRPVRSPQRPGGALPAAPLSLAGAATKGSPGARVAIIEFSDFQCPFCSRFSSETRPRLEQTYVNSGQVLWAFPPPATRNAAPDGPPRRGSVRVRRAKRQGLGDAPSSVRPTQGVGVTLRCAVCDEPGYRRTGVRDLHAWRVEAEDSRRHGGRQGARSCRDSGFPIGVRRPDNLVEVKATLFGAQPFDKFKAEIDKLRLTSY